MSAPIDMTGYIEQYMREWEREPGCGSIVREFARRTGLSMTDTLLYLNWLEQLRTNDAQRRNARTMDEILPLQLKMLKDHERNCGDDEPWSTPEKDAA